MTNIKKQPFTTEIFDSRESAEKAYSEAISRGYKPEEINVVMSDETRKKYYDSFLVKEEGDKSMEGLAMGGALGGAIGGTLGAIIGLGTSIVLPGIGLIVAGPLAAGLAGAGAGSVSGGLIGALIGWGIPEDRAQLYEKGIKSGSIVIGVSDNSERATELHKEWRNYHE